MGQNYMCLYSSRRLPVELVSKKQEHSRVHVSPFPVVCCWGQLSTLEPESAHTHPWSSSVGELIWRGAEHCDSLHCLCAWPKYKQPFLCLSPSLLFCHLNYSLSLSLSLGCGWNRVAAEPAVSPWELSFPDATLLRYGGDVYMTFFFFLSLPRRCGSSRTGCEV